jgi:hypothetical protein
MLDIVIIFLIIAKSKGGEKMKHAEVVETIMQKLVIARDVDVGEILVARGDYKDVVSGRNNARKILKHLTEQGRLEGGDDWFRVPGSKSEHKEHSRHLTKALVKILKAFPNSLVIREKEIPAVKLIPDSLVMLTQRNKGLVLILEAVNNEFPEYLQSKVDVWNTWPEALKHLSGVFGYRIPHFEIVAYPESPLKEVWDFQEFMQEAERC